jgi:Flp pilus assembly pilin Flp
LSAAVEGHNRDVDVRAGSPQNGEADVLQSVYRLRLLIATSGRQSVLTQAQGQALIEYALIISLIALIAIASLRLAGTNVSSLLHTIAGEV